MPASLIDLLDPSVATVPAHCTVREALALAASDGHIHVAVCDGETFSGAVTRSALHASIDGDPSGSRSASTHVCELIEDDALVVAPDTDPIELRSLLRQQGLLEVVVVDDRRVLGVVSLGRLDRELSTKA